MQKELIKVARVGLVEEASFNGSFLFSNNKTTRRGMQTNEYFMNFITELIVIYPGGEVILTLTPRINRSEYKLVNLETEPEQKAHLILV